MYGAAKVEIAVIVVRVLITINCAGQPDLSSEPSLEPISIVGVPASSKI